MDKMSFKLIIKLQSVKFNLSILQITIFINRISFVMLLICVLHGNNSNPHDSS